MADRARKSGRQLRDEGQAAVIAADTAVHRGAGEHIHRAIDECVKTGKPFSSDDVKDLLPADFRPHSTGLIGAIFGGKTQNGRLVVVGSTHTKYPEGRGRRINVYLPPATGSSEVAA